MRRTNALVAPLLALLLTAACAPAAGDAPRVNVQQLTETITYYPSQAGARWEYLPSGARVTDPRVAVQVEGPTVMGDGLLTAWHARGRGLDQMSYRDHTPAGVFLHREERLGTTFRFDPPLMEFPPENQLRVGANWSGTSTVTLTLDGGRERRTLPFDYSYVVVDRRTVTVPAGEFDVFVIDFTSRTYDEEGNLTDELTQQTWFAPYLGEVRTRNGHVLIATNVPAATPKQP